MKTALYRLDVGKVTLGITPCQMTKIAAACERAIVEGAVPELSGIISGRDEM